MSESIPLVSVHCLTFNHADYVEQALRGFVEQKVDFPFEVLVHDDASTDGTQDIIRRYAESHPHIIKPLLQTENKWSKGDLVDVVYNWPRSRGKYVAYCEGDDFWHDPTKLQSQVDHMESHPECGLVHTDFDILCPPGHHYLEADALIRSRRRSGQVFNHLLFGNFISTPTTLLRADAVRDTCEYARKARSFNCIDFWLWLEIASKLEVHFLPRSTATYRIHAAGMSRNQSLMDRIIIHILNHHLCHSLSPALLAGANPEERAGIRDLFAEQLRAGDLNRSEKLAAFAKFLRLFPFPEVLGTLSGMIGTKLRRKLRLSRPVIAVRRG